MDVIEVGQGNKDSSLQNIHVNDLEKLDNGGTANKSGNTKL